MISRNFVKDRFQQLFLLALRPFSSSESNSNGSNQNKPFQDDTNSNNNNRNHKNHTSNPGYNPNNRNSNNNNYQKIYQPSSQQSPSSSTTRGQQYHQPYQNAQNPQYKPNQTHSNNTNPRIANTYDNQNSRQGNNQNNYNQNTYASNNQFIQKQSSSSEQYHHRRNNTNNNSNSFTKPTTQDNITKTTFLKTPQFSNTNNLSQYMIEYLTNPSSYQTTFQQSETENSFKLLKTSYISYQESHSKDIQNSTGIFWQIFIVSQQISGTPCADVIEQLKASKEQPTLILAVLIGKIMDYLKVTKVKRQFDTSGVLSVEQILKLAQITLQRHNIISSFTDCQDSMSETVSSLILLVYHFQTNKLIRYYNQNDLNILYSSLLTIYQDTETNPSLEFAMYNISMLSDIKQKQKEQYQTLKIQCNIFFLRCIKQIFKEHTKIDTYKWVFILYKLAVVDHASYGISIDAFWLEQEKRMLRELNELSLVQRKSLLYSIGKQLIVDNNSIELCRVLVDQKNLEKLIDTPGFLEYFGNILLAGMGRLMIKKEDIIGLLPFMLGLMKNHRISDKEKMEFLGTIMPQVYRLNVLDGRLWSEFFKYSGMMLRDQQKLFNCFFIAKTFVSSEKKNNYIKDGQGNIGNTNQQLFPGEDARSLFGEMNKLLQKIESLPDYQDMLKKIQHKTTQQKQSLFELRFQQNLLAFGKKFTQEHLINNLVSVDFYLVEDNIAVEIQGHSHFIQFQDGSMGLSLPTQFKIDYLESIGIRVIQICPNFQPLKKQYISNLRQFLEQYNKIMEEKKKQVKQDKVKNPDQ